MDKMDGVRRFAQRLRDDYGCVEEKIAPPYFPPITGNYKESPTDGQIRYVPAVISFFKPSPQNPLVQVDLYIPSSEGDFKVVVADARNKKSVHILKGLFKVDASPKDEGGRKVEAFLETLRGRKGTS